MEQIKNYIFENWFWIAPIILEIGLRLIKTGKSYSILKFVVEIISSIVPDRGKRETKIIGEDGMIKKITKNHVIKTLLFVLLSLPAFSQTNLSGKSIRLFNADSLTVKTEVIGLELMYPGKISVQYYNWQASPPKNRCYTSANGWIDCPDGGSANINGLIEAGTNVVITGSGTEADPYVINSAGGGGGIINTSAINEFPKTADVSGNLKTSGVQSTNSGDLNLGLAATGGSLRHIKADGAAANITIDIKSKGSGSSVRAIASNLRVYDSLGSGDIVQISGLTNGILFDQSQVAEIDQDDQNTASPFRMEITSSSNSGGNGAELRISGGVATVSGIGGNVNISGGTGAGGGGAVLANNYNYSSDSTVITKGYFENHTSGQSWLTTGSTTVSTPTINGNITYTQPAASSGTPIGWTFNGGAHTTLAQAVEATDLNLTGLNRTVQFTGGGTFNKQRAIRVIGPTYSATSSTTIGDIATIGFRQPTAGPNVTATNNSALIVTDGTDEVQIALNTVNTSFGQLVFGAGGSGKANRFSIGSASKTTGTPAASGTAARFFSDLNGATQGAYQFGTLTGNTSVLNGTSSVLINAIPTYLQSSSAGNAHYVFRAGHTFTHDGTTGNHIPSFYSNPRIDITNTNASTVGGFFHDPSIVSLNSNSTNKAFYNTSGWTQWNSVLTPAQITSNQNDYNPTGLNNGGAPYGASIIRLTSDASRDLTSLVGGAQGRLLIYSNPGSNNIILKKDNGSSGTASNRVASSGDVVVLPEQSGMLWYDDTSDRWRPLGTPNIANSPVSLTDGASIALITLKHTLTTDEATITFTDSYPGDFIDAEITFNTTSATWTFPSGSLCVVNGTPSGDNTMSITGTSGDKIVLSRQMMGSNKYYIAVNFGQ